MSDNEKVYYWKISWGDGYYPYCSNCGNEPAYETYINGELPNICPKCGVSIKYDKKYI